MTETVDHKLSGRIARYRRLADEARKEADGCTDESSRASFLVVARGWDHLADRLVDQQLR
jgi:hypothetical protein